MSSNIKIVKIKKTNLFIFLFLFLFSLQLLAEETKVPCLKKDGTIGFNIFQDFNCPLMKKVVADPDIKKAHQNKINNKLAERLSFKIERKMEELSTIDKYFNKLELDFTKSDSVKKSCSLTAISTPSCLGNEKVFNQNNYNLLLSKMNSEGSSIGEKMFNAFSKSRGIDHASNKTCPLQAPSGFYSLDGLFDDVTLKTLTKSLQTKNGGKGQMAYLDVAYNKYPQLALINKADSSGTFKKKFEEYVLKNTGNSNSKAYILGFFAEKSNQEMLSNGLENSCTDLRKNIEQFVCNSNEDVMASEETANYLFEGDADIEDTVSVSNAYLCDVKDEVTLKKLDKAGDSFKLFTANVVAQLPVGNEKKATTPVNNFCEIYTCKLDALKETPSCKTGGPISAKDLKDAYKCSDDGEETGTCRVNILQALSYLQSIDTVEIDKQNLAHAKSLGLPTSNTQEESKQTTKKDAKYSSFLQNFLGVEGTLRAEGKAITPHNVAEKAREFEEKKIDTIPQTNREAILASNEGNKVFKMLAQQKQEANQAQSQNQNSQTYVPANLSAAAESEGQRQAIIANSISKFSKSETATAKKDDLQVAKDRDRLNEFSRMKSELESVIKGMKGSEEEKLATIADNNFSLGAKKAAVNDNLKNLSREERERLDEYRASLGNWESKLRSRETDLLERELGSSRSISSDNTDSREERNNNSSSHSDSQVSGQHNVAGGGQNPQALKLAKGLGGSAGATGEKDGKDNSSEKGQGGAVENDVAAIVSAENLATLERGGLKKLGLGYKDSFTIKVKLQERIYDVPVKTFTHNGKTMFVPILNKENRELAQLIIESPLFREYRLYQQERLRSQSI
jgi:hypothetical protein